MSGIEKMDNKTKRRIFIATLVLLGEFLSNSSIYAQTVQDYVNSGDTNLGQENYNQAISDYSKAIEIDPNYTNAYNNRGFAYDELKNFPQAISDYTKAIEIDPNDSYAYAERGYTYAQQGTMTQAFTDLNKGIEIDSNNTDAYYDRAFAYFKEKEYDKAWADVHQADSLGYKPGKEDLEFLDELKKASGVVK